MTKERPAPAKVKILKAGIERFRLHGFSATTVDHICEDAGVTKGAFFHHFESKEQLAEACLEEWERRSAGFDGTAPYREIADPVARLNACLDFYLRFFGDERLITSCLIGTTVQEVSDSHPRLREAANACFLSRGGRFETLIREAAEATGSACDAASLASLWMATIQGSLILYKASQEHSLIRKNLEHARDYIMGCVRNVPTLSER